MNEFDSKPGSTLRARAVALAADLAQSSARDVAFILFRRKWLIFAVALLVVSATLTYIIVTPFTYTSSTQLLVRPGRENIAMDTSMVEGRGVTMSPNNENAVNAAVSILKSPMLADNVVKAFGADTFAGDDEEEETAADKLKALIGFGIRLPKIIIATLKPLDEERVPASPEQVAAAKIRRELEVEPQRRTNLVDVTFTADTPERAQQTLEKIVERFLVRYIEVHAPQTSSQFFEEQLRALEAVLHERQQARDEYLTLHGIATLQSQKEAIVSQINSAEVAKSTAVAEISASRAKIQTLEASLVDRPAAIVTSETDGRNPMVDRLKETLADLRLEESEMAARYAEQYRPLVELRQQIQQVEVMLAEEEASVRSTTTALDPGFQQLKLELDMERATLDALQARETVLTTDVEMWREKLVSLSRQEGELSRLEREFSIAEKEFLSYQDGFLRARTSLALDRDNISNVNVVQPPTYPTSPAAPNVLLIMALGMFLAVFGGVFSAFALEYVDSRVYTKEDIEKHIPAPVLTVITDKEFRCALLKKGVGLPPLLFEEPTAESRDLITLDAAPLMATGSIGEKMFSFSRRLSMLIDHSATGVMLLFAGAQSPRDSSGLIHEYARLLVRQGRRVLVLTMGGNGKVADADALANDQKWLDIMNDGMVVDPALQQVGNSQLFLANMGMTRNALQTLTTSPKFDPLIWKMRSKFDYMLVDCPPLSESAIASRIAVLGDGVILVVDAGRTRWQTVQSHVRDIQATQGRTIGVILNKRKYYVPEIVYKWL